MPQQCLMWYQGVESIPLAFISDIGVSSIYFVCFLAFLILSLVRIFGCRFFWSLSVVRAMNISIIQTVLQIFNPYEPFFAEALLLLILQCQSNCGFLSWTRRVILLMRKVFGENFSLSSPSYSVLKIGEKLIKYL